MLLFFGFLLLVVFFIIFLVVFGCLDFLFSGIFIVGVFFFSGLLFLLGVMFCFVLLLFIFILGLGIGLGLGKFWGFLFGLVKLFGCIFWVCYDGWCRVVMFVIIL